ncbi:hypothetical protein KC959_01700, partial [Candidatus Saccharibacteria bacterium]|nr:hypothetical protein [Candidatus Saccharibacteria bacterium]
FYAIKDRGAWRNSKKLDLGAVPVPNSAFVKKSFTEQLHTLLKPVHISLITPPQGVGYGMAAVASADTAARFNFSGGGHVHDYATGILLVEEAGGVVVPLSDNDVSIHSKSFVACHPEIADFVREHRESLIAIEKQFS